MKLKQTICLSLLVGCLASCQRDSVDDVKFSVSAENVTVKVNEPVHFVFNGNPDYIVFYPGTKTCSYENRNRTEINNIQDLKVSCKVEQVYTEVKAYKDKAPIMSAWISTDFTGESTKEAVAAATWQPLNLEMPKNQKATETVEFTETSIKDYVDKPFFVAFKYKAGPNTFKSNYGKPRVQVKDLTLHKIDTDLYDYSLKDCAYDWGFQKVAVETQPAAEKYDVSESMLLFFPDRKTEKENNVEVWMVSKKLNAKAIDPDRGMPIKGTSYRLNHYEYQYDKPGTYKATFVATNAMMWDASQVVREVMITVTE